jgi:hypothetical protein
MTAPASQVTLVKLGHHLSFSGIYFSGGLW